MFQSIIIDQFIKQQDPQAIAEAYAKFTAHFHDPIIQANIKQAKEEQYQEGFLKDLFVNVFGYTLNPQPDYNLTTELKNLKGAKKCDGAVLKEVNGEKVAIAVIELKGMDTTDLSRIEAQAFGYKNNHPTCRYVITANFQKLRFYIDNAVAFLEFDLFKIDLSEFSLLYLLLKSDNLLADIPLKLKSDSISQEAKITKALYQDYSAFKRALFADLKQHNPDIDELTLFQKSQKLLDRLLFIFFAEDSGLLPPNLAHTMLAEWEQAKKLKIPMSLYDKLKSYFGFLNTGYQDEDSEIFAYNGGLFKPDAVLDTVQISDGVLAPHIKKLADYDFASEVDVNILGHIFENSLSEIDEIKAQINGEVMDKSQTKRKKDGVFYTPKYITSYIVANTVGKLCADKKAEFEIVDGDYITDKKRQKKTQELLLQRLKGYRAWLLTITICDPACGSGAFLNEALNFLMAEHRYLDELESKLFGGGLVFQEVRNHILEHNLFGVDINPESVEIARLSLWLRTAEPHRKLSNLNENVKCGNSLVDDVAVAGDRAFVWADEFPSVFAKGGFDVVIGNPPYVRGRVLTDLERNYLNKYGISSNDLAILFIKKGNEILKKNGLLSYIIPKSLLFASNWDVIRNEIYKFITKLIDCSKVWEEVLLEQVIFVLGKNEISEYKVGERIENEIIENDFISNEFVEIFNFLPVIETNQSLAIGKKIKENSRSLNDFYENIAGVPNQKYIVENGEFNMIGGAEFNRYKIKGSKGKINKEWVSSDNAFIKENTVIVQNIIAHITRPIPHIKITACIPAKEHIQTTTIANTVNQLIPKKDINISNFYCWCLLNSKLINWYVYHFVFGLAIRTMHFYNPISEKVPFIYDQEMESKLIEKAEEMLNLNAELQTLNGKFIRTLEREFNLQKPSKKLQDWHNLTYTDFIKELTKQKITLTLAQKAEWEDYFTQEQQKAQTLQTQIYQTDQHIDQMVYQLYDLTDDEIAIIEQS